MSNRRGLTLILTLFLCLSTSAAFADDPWSAIKPNPTKQITDGTFKKSPLKLPFTQVSVEEIPPLNSAQPSQDFEHIYDASYQEVVAFFDGDEARKQGLAILDASIYPESKGFKVRTSGSGEEGSGMFFRLQHRQLSRDVLLVIEPSGAQTRVVFKNLVLTNVSSGVMPARQGFLGVNFKDVLPFNWN